MKPLELALLLIVGIAGAAPAQRPVLRIATEGTYRPWNYIDDHGHLAGFDIDVAWEICRQLAMRCQIATQDWDGMIPALQMGKFDLVIADMSITPTRRDVIDFSIPYARDDQTMLTNSPTLRLSGGGMRLNVERDGAARNRFARELAGQRIGVLGGASSIAFFQRYVDLRKTSLLRYTSAELLQLDFMAGRIDASLTGVERAREVMSRGGKPTFRVTGPILYGGVLGEGIGVGIAKNRPALRRSVDRAISTALRNGTLRRLSIRWMGVDVTPSGS